MPRANFPVVWSSLRTTETSAPRTTSLRFRPSTGHTPYSSLGESRDPRGTRCKRQQSFGPPWRVAHICRLKKTAMVAHVCGA